MRPIATALAGLALAVLTASCGLNNPYANRPVRSPATATATSTTSTAAAPDSRDPAGERGGTIPTSAQAVQQRLAEGGAEPSARAAVERYARLYINWTAANVAADQRQLASISLGQARVQALQAAASARRDPELTASHVVNRGQLEAVTRGTGAAAGEWVVVTHEQTTGHGDYAALPAQLHVIYAQALHRPQGWVIARWQPQT